MRSEHQPAPLPLRAHLNVFVFWLVQAWQVRPVPQRVYAEARHSRRRLELRSFA